MITSLLFLFLIVFVVIKWLIFKKGIISYENGTLKVHSKYILGLIITVLIILFQPYSAEKIDAGSVGLKEFLIGGKRGVSSVEFASGLQIYNAYTQRIHEVETDTKPIDYGSTLVTAKGGLGVPMHLTFSMRVKPEMADKLFTETRQTFKNGGLKLVQDTWAKTAIMGGVNHVINRYDPDYIFSNINPLEDAITVEVNKRLGKYFEITQMRTNMTPPKSMLNLIAQKAKITQETQNAELDAVKAVSLNKKKVADAQGDLDAAILQAKAKDVLSQPKMLELYKAETDRIRAKAGISEYGTNNVFGSMPGMFLNRK